MGPIKRVYVWERPVRIFHWVNALCITILFLSGLYIGNPVVGVNGEAAKNFFMGNIRYLHVATAMIFTANILFRLYWFIRGNEYAKLKFWRQDFWLNFLETMKYYLFIGKKSTPHVGHNSLAQLFYLLVIWLGGLFMIITGFAMRAGGDPESFLQRLFGWVIPFMGGENTVRMVHHLIAWAFPFFLLGHLYMVFRQDLLDKDGTVTSIISGYKYIDEERQKKGGPVSVQSKGSKSAGVGQSGHAG